MGLAEELEELRKQGLTKQNASGLKDAEGLSTPEDSENAIKAELERTRLANYGKEASDYLKSASPSRKTKSTGVEESKDANPKDITNLIQITNDFAFVDEENAEAAQDEEVAHNPVDCLFGTGQGFCPIDSMESATSSVRGALDEHVSPRLNGIRSALDEHVVPNIDKVRRQSMETVEGFHKRSLETMESARQQSSQAWDSANAGTQQFFGNIANASREGMGMVQQGSQNMLETSQQTLGSMAQGIQSLVSFNMGTAPGWSDLLSNQLFLEGSLRAFGRVVFCDNPVTGIFILVGIVLASPLSALCALLGVATVNLISIYLDMDPCRIRSGQYARNAVLIGASLVDSFGFDFPKDGNLQSGVPILVFWSIALAPCTLALECLWIQKVPNSIPSLLLPFNGVLLASLVASSVWNLASKTQIVFESPSMNDADTGFWIHQAVLNGIARIFFVDGSAWTGLVFLLGVLLCSRIVALSLVTGSFVSTVVLGYWVFGENHWYLDCGYAGANPALCAAGIFFYLVPSWRLTGLAIFGIVATLIVQGAVDVVLGILGTPVSNSLGFCLTLLPLLSIGFPSIFGTSEDYFIRTVPLASLSTPEDYLMGISDTEESTNVAEAPTDLLVDAEDLVTNEETPLL